MTELGAHVDCPDARERLSGPLVSVTTIDLFLGDWLRSCLQGSPLAGKLDLAGVLFTLLASNPFLCLPKLSRLVSGAHFLGADGLYPPQESFHRY